MGSVYVAHDPVLGRMVAIKVFAGDLDLPDARERFSREARAAAALSHPNIVTVYDFGECESQPYIVMEYVAGETLAGFIRRKTPVTLADKIRWMEELCAGAGYAHQMQLVHRDIKPANLMVDADGTLKILDFGLARMPATTLTREDAIIGTLNYMSPEQFTTGRVDHRSDIFSVGAVLYEMACYKQAFPGAVSDGVMARIMHVDPPPLTNVCGSIDPAIALIAAKALQKDPSLRYQDLTELQSDLADVRERLSAPAKHAEVSAENPQRAVPVGDLPMRTGQTTIRVPPRERANGSRVIIDERGLHESMFDRGFEDLVDDHRVILARVLNP